MVGSRLGRASLLGALGFGAGTWILANASPELRAQEDADLLAEHHLILAAWLDTTEQRILERLATFASALQEQLHGALEEALASLEGPVAHPVVQRVDALQAALRSALG